MKREDQEEYEDNLAELFGENDENILNLFMSATDLYQLIGLTTAHIEQNLDRFFLMSYNQFANVVEAENINEAINIPYVMS
jgi:hypothetical protein